MILGLDIIHQLVRDKKLIENLSERELKNPEGAVIDLRIARALELEGEGFLGVEERETPRADIISDINSEKKTLTLAGRAGDYRWPGKTSVKNKNVHTWCAHLANLLKYQSLPNFPDIL